MREVLKDTTVAFDGKDFRYVNQWYENHGSTFDSEGIVSISQVDKSGKENGLYVCNHYYHTSQAYDKDGYTTICAMKDGQVDGVTYGFMGGKLAEVIVGDTNIGPEDGEFDAYRKTAPDFKKSFGVLEKVAKLASTDGKSKKESKGNVSCEISKTSRTYTCVREGEPTCSLRMNNKGYVTLSQGDNKVASISLPREKGVENIGGYEQYQTVLKDIDVSTMDCVLELYKKIQDDNFFGYGDKGQSVYGEDRQKVGKLVKRFLDAYVFNTPESRDVLNDYLNRETKEDKQHREQSNATYLSALKIRDNVH